MNLPYTSQIPEKFLNSDLKVGELASQSSFAFARPIVKYSSFMTRPKLYDNDFGIIIAQAL